MNQYIKNQTFTFILRAYFPLPLRLIGVIMIVGFLFQTVRTFNPLFLILSAIGVVIVFAKIGTEINLRLKLYRFSFALFGKHFGGWKNIEQIDYLNIFPTKTSQRIATARSLNTTDIINREIRINFIYKNRKRDHVFSTNQPELARELAQEMCTSLNLGLYDCIGEQNKWTIPKPT